MEFYVQMHLHTSETSRCGEDNACDMMNACKRAGYGLVVVTDHFMNANIRVSFGMTWPEKVEALMKGYSAAKAEGDRIGLTVLFGWETYTKGPEYLTYGLGEAFLLKNPGIDRLPPQEYLSAIKAAGGFVSHAHPYREAIYIPHFEPITKGIDAIEVFNAGNDNPAWNKKALALAKRANLIKLAGSDAHDVSRVGYGAVKLDRPVRTMEELTEALKERRGQVVEHMPVASVRI
jgi:predicted metal-dependent phosphoesterase TrpH